MSAMKKLRNYVGSCVGNCLRKYLRNCMRDYVKGCAQSFVRNV